MIGACLVVFVALTGIGQAVWKTWPTRTTSQLAKLSSGANLCAIFALGKGVIEVDCATKVTDGYDNVRAFQCPTVGSDQVCQNMSGGAPVKISVFDSMPVKASKVCGPAGAVYTTYK